jgi:F0F1-type ATP synthase alpha subunit
LKRSKKNIKKVKKAEMRKVKGGSGVRPAINAGISVSRVGGAAQIKVVKR